MLYAGTTLAIIGFVVGVMFRFRVLLPILLALLLVSVAFALGDGLSFFRALWIVVLTQVIVQLSYFLGLVARAVFASDDRMRRVL